MRHADGDSLSLCDRCGDDLFEAGIGWRGGPILERRIVIPPALLAWNNGTVQQLIRQIKQDQDHTQLPLLADALEEAGWTGPNLLKRLRAGDVRLIDLLPG